MRDRYSSSDIVTSATIPQPRCSEHGVAHYICCDWIPELEETRLQIQIQIRSNPIGSLRRSRICQIVRSARSIKGIPRSGSEILRTRTAVIVPRNVASNHLWSLSLVAGQYCCVEGGIGLHALGDDLDGSSNATDCPCTGYAIKELIDDELHRGISDDAEWNSGFVWIPCLREPVLLQIEQRLCRVGSCWVLHTGEGQDC